MLVVFAVALFITLAATQLIAKRMKKPLLRQHWSIPTHLTQIDWRIWLGGALFGSVKKNLVVFFFSSFFLFFFDGLSRGGRFRHIAQDLLSFLHCLAVILP